MPTFRRVALAATIAGTLAVGTATGPASANTPKASKSADGKLSTSASITHTGTTDCGRYIAPETPKPIDVLNVGYPVRKINFKGRVLWLRNLRIPNRLPYADWSYAHIVGFTIPGDRVWVDRSTNGKKTWTQCGPFSRSWSNMLSNRGAWMRACLDIKVRPWSKTRKHKCTEWYNDKG
ncbi:hypothetical protein [Streptosporangium sp. KLBMP 9127]|nr:hypothetical protein [Streptosporangium sp. KLBMP 9127]